MSTSKIGAQNQLEALDLAHCTNIALSYHESSSSVLRNAQRSGRDIQPPVHIESENHNAEPRLEINVNNTTFSAAAAGSGNVSNKEPGSKPTSIKKDRKARKMRKPRPTLMKWTGKDWEMVAIGMLCESGRLGISLPLEEAVRFVDSNCTCEEFEEAMLALRERKMKQGIEIPLLKIRWAENENPAKQNDSADMSVKESSINETNSAVFRSKTMWTSDDWEVFVLGLVCEAGHQMIKLPFAEAARFVKRTLTGSALQQALLKLRRKKTTETGIQIPALTMSWNPRPKSAVHTSALQNAQSSEDASLPKRTVDERNDRKRLVRKNLDRSRAEANEANGSQEMEDVQLQEQDSQDREVKQEQHEENVYMEDTDNIHCLSPGANTVSEAHSPTLQIQIRIAGLSSTMEAMQNNLLGDVWQLEYDDEDVDIKPPLGLRT